MSQPVSIKTKNNKHVILRKLHSNDVDRLEDYLQNLSNETKAKFHPHHNDKQSIIEFYSWPNENTGFIVEDQEHGELIAYSIIKCGYLQHDKERLESYGLKPDEMKCGTFAPSVSDTWRNVGVGTMMLEYILKELRMADILHVILWGGVQATNEKAIQFYKKAGFETLGRFEHFGLNYDMMLNMQEA